MFETTASELPPELPAASPDAEGPPKPRIGRLRSDERPTPGGKARRPRDSFVAFAKAAPGGLDKVIASGRFDSIGESADLLLPSDAGVLNPLLMKQHSFRVNSVPRVALIAHDNHKPELVEFVSKNLWFFSKCKLCGTSSTMKICGGLGLQFESMDSLAKELAPDFKGESPIKKFCSGPIGGDIQLALLIIMNKMDGVFFFQDKGLKLQLQPHKADVIFFDRICKMHQDDNDYDLFLASSSKGDESDRLVDFLVEQYPDAGFNPPSVKTSTPAFDRIKCDEELQKEDTAVRLQKFYRRIKMRRMDAAKVAVDKARKEFKDMQANLNDLKLRVMRYKATPTPGSWGDITPALSPALQAEIARSGTPSPGDRAFLRQTLVWTRKKVRELRDKYELMNVTYLIERTKFKGKEAELNQRRADYLVEMGIKLREASSKNNEQEVAAQLHELEWQRNQLLTKQQAIDIPAIQEFKVCYKDGSEYYFYASKDLVDEVVGKSGLAEHPNVASLTAGPERTVEAGVVCFIGSRACAENLAGVFISHRSDWGKFKHDMDTLYRIMDLYDLPVAINEITRKVLIKRLQQAEISRQDVTNADKKYVALVLDGNDQTYEKLNEYAAFQLLKFWIAGEVNKANPDAPAVDLDSLLVKEKSEFPSMAFNQLLTFLASDMAYTPKYEFIKPVRDLLNSIAAAHPELRNPDYYPFQRIVLFNKETGLLETFEKLTDLDKEKHLAHTSAVFLFADPLVGRTREAKKQIEELINYCSKNNILLTKSMKQAGFLFDGHSKRQTKHNYIEYYREARKLQLLIISQQIKNQKKTEGNFDTKKAASNILS